MDLFELTRALVDIESTTGHEKNVGDYLFANLSALTAGHNGQIERIPAEPDRDNILARWGEPVVTLSTHMDTVPLFFASHEDGDFIGGRGSCDAKGIIAAMIAAAEKTSGRGHAQFRTALRCRRRTQQRGGQSCRGNAARLAISYQWRAY